MAKKQQKNTGKKTAPSQKTDMINTNMFIKGMNKDTDSSYFDKQSWYHFSQLLYSSLYTKMIISRSTIISKY